MYFFRVTEVLERPALTGLNLDGPVEVHTIFGP